MKRVNYLQAVSELYFSGDILTKDTRAHRLFAVGSVVGLRPPNTINGIAEPWHKTVHTVKEESLLVIA